MRIVPLIVAILLFSATAFAGEIREFDIKTIERLGNELTQVSQTRDQGASSPVKKLARKTAIAALNGRLFNIRYDDVVLDDPDGSGFLVYALGRGSKRGDVVIHGHFRVTVSSEGEKAERVDALSHSVIIDNKNVDPSPQGYHRVDFVTSQSVGTRPVETLVYASNLMKMPIIVATLPDGRIWEIKNGILKDTGKFAGKQR